MNKKRKIGFYYLTINTTYSNVTVQDAFNHVLSFIDSQNKQGKKQNLTTDKICFLDTLNSYNDNTRHRIVFKSAIHSFRPPLLDSETVDERENPKRIEEGERQKTHVVAKFINGDIIILLEKYQNSISINQLINYLNDFVLLSNFPEPIKFSYEALVKESFIEELDNLKRVVSADIFVDKQLLGSQALNYSERLHSVQHEVAITVKAKTRDNIYDFVNDMYSTFNGGANSITRIRIIGRNSDNNEIKINTDFIERQEYVFAEYNNETGEIISNSILIEMETVLHNFK